MEREAKPHKLLQLPFCTLSGCFDEKTLECSLL